MALILISGLPGSGKTTVRNELKTRGYEAYDGDEDGLARWYNDETGAVVKKREERTPEFVKAHSRIIARDVVEEFAVKAQENHIFICNNPENEAELMDLFPVRFALVVDEATRNMRLTTRTNNEWGKLPHELEYSLAFAAKAQVIYRQYGHVVLDSGQPTPVIVDKIIEQCRVKGLVL